MCDGEKVMYATGWEKIFVKHVSDQFQCPALEILNVRWPWDVKVSGRFNTPGFRRGVWVTGGLGSISI